MCSDAWIEHRHRWIKQRIRTLAYETVNQEQRGHELVITWWDDWRCGIVVFTYQILAYWPCRLSHLTDDKVLSTLIDMHPLRNPSRMAQIGFLSLNVLKLSLHWNPPRYLLACGRCNDINTVNDATSISWILQKRKASARDSRAGPKVKCLISFTRKDFHRSSSYSRGNKSHSSPRTRFDILDRRLMSSHTRAHKFRHQSFQGRS